jgi:hypothetical protein
MTNLHNHLNNEAHSIRMTDEEKRAMRMRLMEALGTTSAAPASLRPSPYAFMFAPRSLAVLGLAVLLVVSTGTAYAAEGSLPGAPLYSVKVQVIEPLTVALAHSPAAKAQVHADLAVRRVEEAQTLAAEGTLTPQVAQEISTNYNAHAEAALALAHDADASAGIATSTVPTEATTTTETPDAHPAVAVEPAPAMKTAVTMSVRVAPAASTSTAAQEAEATTSAVPAAATTTQIGLAGKLHATLSAEASILKSLNAQVRQHMGKGHATTTGAAATSSASTPSSMPMRRATHTQPAPSAQDSAPTTTVDGSAQTSTDTSAASSSTGEDGSTSVQTKGALHLNDIIVPSIFGDDDSGN